MKVLRTPENRFANLPDYPFEPHYTTIRTAEGADIRIHHIDEGPRDGAVVLCLHGQPTWSYLYRKMIPLLNAGGLRVIAPDLPGYGKSDKPAAREDYTYQRQVDWMNAWLGANDLSNLTFFGQDWGGLIGLRLVAAQPNRFARVVISNTGLPYVPELPAEDVRAVLAFREKAGTPSLVEMAQALRQISTSNRARKFAYWQKFCWETVDLPVGFMMKMSTDGGSRLSQAISLGLQRIGLGNAASTPLARAYDAPFPDPSFKMAPRAMPSQVPTLPSDVSQEAQRLAWEFFRGFQKPFLCAFSDDDPVTRGGDRQFIEQVPGARGQSHSVIKGGGHFIQEQRPAEISKAIVDFVRASV